jgi:hypothetical protein
MDMSLSRSKLNEEEARKLSNFGQPQYPNGLRIIWDGSRWPVTMHRDYLQLLEEKVSNADGRSSHVQRG